MIGLRVVRPGLMATVQDGGRFGWRRFGVPSAGVWDRGAWALANLLVGNHGSEAVVELTMIGGEFKATGPLAIGLAGAVMPAWIASSEGDRRLWMPCSASLDAGERLVLGASTVGARTYLSVRGGWHAPEVMGSGSSERRLESGDFLGANAADRFSAVRLRPDPDPGSAPIRYTDGIERVELDPSMEFSLRSESDRMGLRLDGPTLAVNAPADRKSTPVAPGTMQVAGGRLIVLGVACGTMGGYPQVGQVISADLDRLGQLRPGDRVRFARVGIDEARRLDAESRHRRAVYLSRIACALSFNPATR